MSNDVTYLDPVSGGYVAVNNQLVKAPPAVNKVNRLLQQVVGQDLQYPLNGNPLLTAKTFQTSNQIINGITTCLSPLLNSGEISKLTFLSLTLSPTKRWKVNISILLPNGSTTVLTWNQRSKLSANS